jgi:hypothetical protein
VDYPRSVKVDRVACPWLIKNFVDKDAEFVFVPPDKVIDEAKRLDAIAYDVKNVELGHHGQECSFEAGSYRPMPAISPLTKQQHGAGRQYQDEHKFAELRCCAGLSSLEIAACIAMAKADANPRRNRIGCAARRTSLMKVCWSSFLLE